jgi:hypothetical protein
MKKQFYNDIIIGTRERNKNYIMNVYENNFITPEGAHFFKQNYPFILKNI